MTHEFDDRVTPGVNLFRRRIKHPGVYRLRQIRVNEPLENKNGRPLLACRFDVFYNLSRLANRGLNCRFRVDEPKTVKLGVTTPDAVIDRATEGSAGRG